MSGASERHLYLAEFDGDGQVEYVRATEAEAEALKYVCNRLRRIDEGEALE